MIEPKIRNVQYVPFDKILIDLLAKLDTIQILQNLHRIVIYIIIYEEINDELILIQSHLRLRKQ